MGRAHAPRKEKRSNARTENGCAHIYIHRRLLFKFILLHHTQRKKLVLHIRHHGCCGLCMAKGALPTGHDSRKLGSTNPKAERSTPPMRYFYVGCSPSASSFALSRPPAVLHVRQHGGAPWPCILQTVGLDVTCPSMTPLA